MAKAGFRDAAVDKLRETAARFDRRRRIALVVLIGWAGIVTLGAGARAEETNWVGVPSLDWMVYVIFGLMVLGLILVVVLFATVGRTVELDVPRRRRSVWPTIILILLFAGAANFLQPGDNELSEAEQPPVPTAEELEDAARDLPDPVGLDAPDIAGIAFILLVAVVAMLWTRARTEDEPEPEPEPAPDALEQALSPAVGHAAEQLATATDPRSAVLLSYRDLELAIERLGLPRRSSETAVEHLQRVLRSVTIDTGPLLALAGLYELARFSDRVITADDQRTAAGALRRVADQLVVGR